MSSGDKENLRPIEESPWQPTDIDTTPTITVNLIDPTSDEPVYVESVNFPNLTSVDRAEIRVSPTPDGTYDPDDTIVLDVSYSCLNLQCFNL